MIGSDFIFQHWMIDKPPEMNAGKCDMIFRIIWNLIVTDDKVKTS